MALKDSYQKDSDVGIRNMRDIKSSPVKELTDDEIVKLFFDRFNAEALVMMYQDKQGLRYFFGRARINHKADSFIREVKDKFYDAFGDAENWKEV